jgi:hypothetical protein
MSAILSAPWHALSSVGLAIGACGLTGVVYAVMVIRHTRRQTGYAAVFEDWLWHCILPLIAYAALLVAGIVLMGDPSDALFVVAAAAVLLLFIGIHNAWDAVTYHVFVRRRGNERHH